MSSAKLRAWWTMVRLRFRFHGPTLRRPRRKRLTPRQRGLFYFFAFLFCAVPVVAAGVFSYFALGLPQLNHLDGSPFRGDEIILLDPERSDETLLYPGAEYSRPIAVVHTGAEEILLRVRLEEVLLELQEGILARVQRFDDDVPHTITQQEALDALRGDEFVPDDASWERALETRLPASRLPNQFNDGGRILVFERRTVTLNEDNADDLPDLSLLLPEDIERMNLGTVEVAFMGFFYVNDAYQPLRIEATGENITRILYEFEHWDISRMDVHLFDEEHRESYVVLQLGESLRPIGEWTEPEDAWFYAEDGWIYYGSPLPPGLMTPLVVEAFSVASVSTLAPYETRYRLRVRVQHAPLDFPTLLTLWNSHMDLEGFGGNSITQEAGDFLMALFDAAGVSVGDGIEIEEDDPYEDWSYEPPY